MVITHNMPAIGTQRILNKTSISKSKSSEKLSSGYKINRAADNAAGLSISEKMRSQIRGLNQAARNIQDGINVIQVADSALNETHSILQRMNELTVQAANDTNTFSDKSNIKKEIDALALEIDRISSSTEFNNQKLLDGSFKEKQFQVGANSEQTIAINMYAIDTHGLGLAFSFANAANISWIDQALAKIPSIKNIGNQAEDETAYENVGNYIPQPDGSFIKAKYIPQRCLSLSNHDNINRSMKLIQNSIELVSEMRSSLGASQNRLEHALSNAQNSSENTQAAESRIRDVNLADEMVSYSSNNILIEAGQSMLAQANKSNQSVLGLLG